jgi:hypothetical protein
MTFEEQLEAHYEERRDWYKRTGGPAAALPEVRGHDGEGITEAWPGLTIRDHFASAAITGIMAGLMAPSNDGHWHGWKPAAIASEAYLIADAMLKAREE